MPEPSVAAVAIIILLFLVIAVLLANIRSLQNKMQARQNPAIAENRALTPPQNPATAENRAFKAFLLFMMGLVAAAAAILIALLLGVESPPAGGNPTASPTSATRVATATGTPVGSATPGVAGEQLLPAGVSPGSQISSPMLLVAAQAQPAVPTPTTSLSPTTTPTSTSTPTPPASGGVAPPPGSLPNPPPPGSFGVFDLTQSANLSAFTKFLVATIVLIAASIVEMLLVTLYAAFFVNDPANIQLSLGLPPATVRVVLVGLIVLVILVFGLLPEIWGGNRAVVLLLGLLSTVIGFYFGSRASADSPSGAAPPVRLTLEPSSKVQTITRATPVVGTLDTNFQATLGSNSVHIVAVLLRSSGVPLPNSQAMGLVDRNGRAEFDFSQALNNAAPGSYIVQVQSPSNVQCDERITLQEP